MFINANAAVALAALALSIPATAIQRCEPADLTPMARAELTAVFMDDESSPAAGRSLWAYTVRVENTGRDPLTLIGRCLEVQGKGQPVEIYADFRYASHPRDQGWRNPAFPPANPAL